MSLSANASRRWRSQYGAEVLSSGHGGAKHAHGAICLFKQIAAKDSGSVPPARCGCRSEDCEHPRLAPVHARKRAPVASDRICPHTEKRTQRRKSTTQAIERTSRHSSHTLLPLKRDVAAARSGRSAGCRAVIPQHTLPSPGGITCCVTHNVGATPSARLPSSWPPLQLPNSVGVNNWYPKK